MAASKAPTTTQRGGTLCVTSSPKRRWKRVRVPFPTGKVIRVPERREKYPPCRPRDFYYRIREKGSDPYPAKKGESFRL